MSVHRILKSGPMEMKRFVSEILIIETDGKNTFHTVKNLENK